MKKILALTLAAVLALSALTGCDIHPNPYKDADPSASPSPEVAEPAETDNAQAISHDFAAAAAAYDGDMVVATVNGLDITWDEYYYWLMTSLMNVEMYVGIIDDLNEDFAGMSYADYIKTVAETNCRQYRTIEYYAAQEGVELSEEAELAIAELLKSEIDAYSPDGTEEGFNEYLESIFTSREMYDYICRVSMLYNELFNHVCGSNCENISDSEALGFAEEAGVTAAKPILFKTVDDSYQPLSDEEIASKKALADEALAGLLAEADPAAAFDSYVAEYGEDPGSAFYADGYCYTPGTMVAAFEDAVNAMQPGEMTTELVESDYGYPIILRMPLRPDRVTMNDMATLRQLAASQLFADTVNAWYEQSPIEYAEGFEPDLSVLFAVEEAAE